MTTSNIKTLDELEFLNLLLNLLKEAPHKGVNNILKNEGYQIFSIEKNVMTDSGCIKFDLCIIHKEKQAFYGIELKGGTVPSKSEQFDRYTSFDHIQYLRNEAVNTYDTKLVFNILIIFNANKSDIYTLSEGIYKDFKYCATNLKDGVIVEFKTLTMEKIVELVNKENIDINDIHPIILFDKETGDALRANYVYSMVDSILLSSKTEFTVDDIIEGAYCSIPEITENIGADIKGYAISTIKKILKEMSKNGYDSIIKWENQVWKVMRKVNLSDVKKARSRYISYCNKNKNTNFGYEQLDFETDLF